MGAAVRAAKVLDRVADNLLWVARGAILLSVLMVAWFAADREPPFAVIQTYPAEARPGDWITLTADVRRDTHRNCSAEFSRFIFDATHRRYDLGSAIATADMIGEMQLRTPNRLVVSVRLPETITPGQARLLTALQYKCNRVHELWPISVTTTIPFTVLP